MRTISVVLAGLLTLAACGDDDPTAGDDPNDPPPSRTSPTVTPDPQPGMTAPGAELALGEPATVPVRSFQDPVGGTAEITVRSIEEVPAEDVASSGYDATDDVRLFLVRADATLTEVTELRIFAPAVDLVALTEDGQIATALPAEEADRFACAAAEEASPEKGDELSVCEVVAAPGEGTVDRVQFAPYAGDYSPREGAPLTWR